MNLTRRKFLLGTGAAGITGLGAAALAAKLVWEPRPVIRAIVRERLPNAQIPDDQLSAFIEAYIPWDRSITRKRTRFYEAFPVVTHGFSLSGWVPGPFEGWFEGLERRVVTAFVHSTTYDVNRPDDPQDVSFLRLSDPYSAYCFNRLARSASA